MELRKTTLGEDAADELIRVLYKIFTERCGLDVHIHTEFVEQEEEKKKRSGRADIDRQAALLAETMLELKAAQDQAAGGQAEGQAGGRADGTDGAGASKQGGSPKAAGARRRKRFPKLAESGLSAATDRASMPTGSICAARDRALRAQGAIILMCCTAGTLTTPIS